MTIYYVGSGGNDGNNGTTWALRKLTLNGAEDIPVAAGDTVYVAPGVYREMLTCDVSGTAGNPISYIGDVTGEYTDGIGGVVRVTGSDNDQTVTRTYGFTGTSKNYRTFQGFSFDTFTTAPIRCATTGTNWTIQDGFISMGSAETAAIYITGIGGNHVIQRTMILGGVAVGIYFTHTSTFASSNNLVSDCLFLGGAGGCIQTDRVSGITVRNSTFIARAQRGVYVATALAAGETCVINNCIFYGIGAALAGTTNTQLIEDYNTFYGNTSDRTLTNTGANSKAFVPVLNPPLMLAGYRFPWFIGELSKWSQVARLGGSGESTTDLFGLTRPVTSAKKSWGAIQYTGAQRADTTADSGSSLKLLDAGQQLVMRIPTTNATATVSLKVYREATYTGDNPQLLVRQPGQAEVLTTDSGAANTWNTLTAVVPPTTAVHFADVFFISSNTTGIGYTTGGWNVGAYCDTLTVS